ncbi:MAG: DUF4783 domain-containing protein [Ignavibacteriaceae bacterium]|nr:DUF4783 domain-containing protein [Ignavibacteriaceae bacterium]
MIKNFYLIFFVLIAGLSDYSVYSQDNKLTGIDNGKQNSAKVVLLDIENSIAKGNINALFKNLSPLTYFSLTNGIRGYYSSNQAYYILEDFFKIYQVISFRFHSLQSEDGNPYATGIYFYQYKGKRESSQVYVSLKNTGKSWKITQITFN